ncbi:MAG: hypothetical protein ACPIA7_08165 [Akkermansiaceae bacterium]
MVSLVEGYYHCDQCGSIFEAQILGVSQQTCSRCGHLLTGGDHAPAEIDFEADLACREQSSVMNDGTSGQDVDSNKASVISEADKVAHDPPLVAQKKRAAQQMKLIAISWLVFVVVVVAIVFYFNRSSAKFATETRSSQQELEKQKDAEKQKMKLALPKCMMVIKSFVNAKTASAKAQFVHDGVRLSREMEAYYAEQADFRTPLLQARPIYYHALNISGADAIGAICQTDTGERFEVIFILQDGEWKIEWKSFVRYSEHDWSTFLTGAGADEAEFRLYMRVMDVREDLAAGDVLVQFYKPDIFRGHKFDGYASDVIRVPAYSIQGKLLRDMIQRADETKGGDLVGMQFADFDPKQLHRVRARMRSKINAKQELEVHLVRLIANHWYDPVVVEKSGLAEELK